MVVLQHSVAIQAGHIVLRYVIEDGVCDDWVDIQVDHLGAVHWWQDADRHGSFSLDDGLPQTLLDVLLPNRNRGDEA